MIFIGAKMGFGIPLSNWIKGPLLSEQRFIKSQFVKEDGFNPLFKKFLMNTFMVKKLGKLHMGYINVSILVKKKKMSKNFFIVSEDKYFISA